MCPQRLPASSEGPVWRRSGARSLPHMARARREPLLWLPQPAEACYQPRGLANMGRLGAGLVCAAGAAALCSAPALQIAGSWAAGSRLPGPGMDLLSGRALGLCRPPAGL